MAAATQVVLSSVMSYLYPVETDGHQTNIHYVQCTTTLHVGQPHSSISCPISLVDSHRSGLVCCGWRRSLSFLSPQFYSSSATYSLFSLCLNTLIINKYSRNQFIFLHFSNNALYKHLKYENQRRCFWHTHTQTTQHLLLNRKYNLYIAYKHRQIH